MKAMTMAAERVYVGGFPRSTSEGDLQALLSRALTSGQAAVQLMRTADGESRGFAFAEVANADEARWIVDVYDKTKWRGARLRVGSAHEDYMARLRREWAERAQEDKPESRPPKPPKPPPGPADDDTAPEHEPGATLRLRRYPGTQVRYAGLYTPLKPMAL